MWQNVCLLLGSVKYSNFQLKGAEDPKRCPWWMPGRRQVHRGRYAATCSLKNNRLRSSEASVILTHGYPVPTHSHQDTAETRSVELELLWSPLKEEPWGSRRPAG